MQSAGLEYERAGMHKEAADCYWNCKALREAVDCSYLCKMYDRVLDELTKVESEGIDFDFKGCRRECIKKATLHYHNIGDEDQMMQYLSMHTAITDKRAFLERHKYTSKLIDIEIQEGNIEYAANHYLREFDYKNAAHYFEKAGLEVSAVSALVASIRYQVLDKDFTPRLSDTSETVRTKLQEAKHMITATLLSKSNKQQKENENLKLWLLELEMFEIDLEIKKAIDNQRMNELVNLTQRFTSFRLLFNSVRLVLGVIYSHPNKCEVYCNEIIVLLTLFKTNIKSVLKSLAAFERNSSTISHTNRLHLNDCLSFFDASCKNYTSGSVISPSSTICVWQKKVEVETEKRKAVEQKKDNSNKKRNKIEVKEKVATIEYVLSPRRLHDVRTDMKVAEFCGRAIAYISKFNNTVDGYFLKNILEQKFNELRNTKFSLKHWLKDKRYATESKIQFYTGMEKLGYSKKNVLYAALSRAG